MEAVVCISAVDEHSREISAVKYMHAQEPIAS